MAKKRKQSVVLCDTNIFLEILKGNEQVMLAFAKIGEENVAINPIIKAELYRGAQDKEDYLSLKNELKKFQNFKLDLPTSKKFEELMMRYAISHRPMVADMLIASTALVNSLPLYTLNTKDFVFLEDLQLYTP